MWEWITEMGILIDRSLFDHTEVSIKKVIFDLNLPKNKEQIYYHSLSFYSLHYN